MKTEDNSTNVYLEDTQGGEQMGEWQYAEHDKRTLVEVKHFVWCLLGTLAHLAQWNPLSCPPVAKAGPITHIHVLPFWA